MTARTGRYPYTTKLPTDQLQSINAIHRELKNEYGAKSPDKSAMIEQAIGEWLINFRRNEADRAWRVERLLEMRQQTRKRQYNRKESND